MTPANVNRVEITLSDDRLAALDAARGFEPRASFIKRVLEQALSDSPTGGEREVDAAMMERQRKLNAAKTRR